MPSIFFLAASKTLASGWMDELTVLSLSTAASGSLFFHLALIEENLVLEVCKLDNILIYDLQSFNSSSGQVIGNGAAQTSTPDMGDGAFEKSLLSLLTDT